MAKKTRHLGETPATAWLRREDVPFDSHGYDYVDRGGTAKSARQLEVAEHDIVKTLVLEDEGSQPLLVLMHGDRQVGLKSLARQIGARSVSPCRPDAAQRHSGYQVGGTSPFGTRKPLRVFVEASILDRSRIYINGGSRGHLVSLAPSVLVDKLGAVAVRCAQ